MQLLSVRFKQAGQQKHQFTRKYSVDSHKYSTKNDILTLARKNPNSL